MALPATDSFTDSDGTQLTAHNASWTLCSGDFDIQSNSLAADLAASECLAGWNADAFNADQYAEATVVAIGLGSCGIGVAVRCDDDTPDDTGYMFYGDSNVASYLAKLVNGAWTQLGNNGAVFQVNDVIRLEVEGVNPGTITPKVDGAEEDPPGAQTDSDIDAGSAGVSGWWDGTVSRIDNWEGGNLGAVTPAISVSESLGLSDSVTAHVVGPHLSIAVTPDNAAYYKVGPVVVGA